MSCGCNQSFDSYSNSNVKGIYDGFLDVLPQQLPCDKQYSGSPVETQIIDNMEKQTSKPKPAFKEVKLTDLIFENCVCALLLLIAFLIAINSEKK